MELSSCRLCGEPGAAISIFSRRGEDSLCWQAMSCAHISIEPGDGLPEVVCSGCSCQLSASYSFKLKCETSDRYFRDLLSLKREKEVDEDEEKNDEITNDDFIDNDDAMSIGDETLLKEEIVEKVELDTNYPNIRIRKDSIIEGLTKTEIKLEDDKISESKDLKLGNAPNKENSIKDYKKGGKTSFACKMCNKKYKVIDRYNKHLTICGKLNHHKGRTASKVELLEWLKIDKNQLNKSEDNIDIQDKNLDKQMRRFMCDICGGTYKNLQVLVQHQKTHTGAKLYSCSLCKKKFTRSSHVVSHMRIHNNIKPYICEICGRSFIKSSDLARHRRIHFDARNYSCPLCSRRFKRSSDVTSHLRSHTGDRPYSCACGKSYTSQSSLQKHKKINCSDKPKDDSSAKNTLNTKPKTEVQKV